jgi:uncharacterized protein (DUF4415 family)
VRSQRKSASSTSDEQIVTYTLEELRKLPSQSDWARINAMTEEEIRRSEEGDPDLEGLDDLDWSQAEWVNYGAKQPISIRLDPDVLAYFKSGGPRYQSRINAVLKAYVRSAEKRKAKAAGKS